jgi:hypothetical protein
MEFSIGGSDSQEIRPLTKFKFGLGGRPLRDGLKFEFGSMAGHLMAQINGRTIFEVV